MPAPVPVHLKFPPPHASPWAPHRQYEGWGYCEPNDQNNQDCMHMYGNGRWNDVSCSLRANALLVEYGGML